MTEEPLVSLAEAARNIGVHRSTLSRQTASGQVRNWGGKVRVSEVVADRAANVKPPVRQAQQRVGQSPDIQSVHAPHLPLHAPIQPTHAPIDREAVGAWCAGLQPEPE
jgi:transposase-like protein